MKQGLSTHDHLKSILGPDTSIEQIDRFVYGRATSRSRRLADELIDAVARYLAAASDRDHVMGISGEQSIDRDREVKELHRQALMKAYKFDKATMPEAALRVSVGDIRSIIHEEQMRGIPEFAVREATRKFVEELRQHVRRHVQMTRGSDVDARDVLEKAEEAFLQLEEETNKLADENLWRLLQRI